MSQHRYVIATSWNEKPVSEHFRALANELARQGHQVTLLVDGRKTDVENLDGNPAVLTWPSPRPTQLKDAVFLIKLFLKDRPDFVIANFGSTNLMLLVGALFGVPCRIAWYRTLSTQINMDNHLPADQLSRLQWRKQWVYNLATHLIANSQATREDLQAVYQVPDGKCKVFYNSLADPLRNGVTLPINRKANHKIVCVGRLEKSKGQDILIQAVALLREFDVTVEFIGGGPLRNDYEMMAQELGIADRCHFIGNVPHEEVYTRMAAAAAIVVPSRTEAFGWVNIEALSLGKPVIASDTGGIREIIQDGQVGYLVPPEDPVQLAEKIIVVLQEDKLREKLGLNARRHFLMHFEQERMVRQQIEWFEEILTARLHPANAYPTTR